MFEFILISSKIQGAVACKQHWPLACFVFLLSSRSEPVLWRIVVIVLLGDICKLQRRKRIEGEAARPGKWFFRRLPSSSPSSPTMTRCNSLSFTTILEATVFPDCNDLATRQIKCSAAYLNSNDHKTVAQESKQPVESVWGCCWMRGGGRRWK